MWQIDNRTPFAAERGWVRDRNGAEIWLVAVKATFDVRPDGTTDVSKAQPPVLRLPEHFGEPGKSSIKYDADLVLTKKTTDVIVVGHAHGPGGNAVTQLDVGFKVGPVQKLLRVFGDRRWKGIGMSAPEPFTKMPLVYERAFGGADKASSNPEKDWEWRNPVGTGFAVSGSNATGLSLPNFEDPNKLISSWSDRPSPAGFGAVASHWQPRVGFAGTYDDHWMKTRQPLLAEDLDDRYFQSAPSTSRRRSSCAAASPWCCSSSHRTGTCASRCRRSTWVSKPASTTAAGKSTRTASCIPSSSSLAFHACRSCGTAPCPVTSRCRSWSAP
jgi:hypothetical protein